MSDLSDLLTVTLLIWAFWVICSQSLICPERSERIAHSRSFDLSDLSEFPALIKTPTLFNIWHGSKCLAQKPYIYRCIRSIFYSARFYMLRFRLFFGTVCSADIGSIIFFSKVHLRNPPISGEGGNFRKIASHSSMQWGLGFIRYSIVSILVQRMHGRSCQLSKENVTMWHCWKTNFG